MSLNSIMATATSGMSVAQTGPWAPSPTTSPTPTRPATSARSSTRARWSSQGWSASASVVAQVPERGQPVPAGGQPERLGQSWPASSAIADLLDQAQSLFGDPSSSTSYFNQLNSVFTAFTAAANDPASNLSRAQTLDQITSFLSSTQRISNQLQGLSQQADTRIGSDVDQINQLVSQIDGLNTDITRTQSTGGDATGSMDAQSQALDKLSTLMDINVANRPGGGVVVRAGSGALLTDGSGPATLAYIPSSGGAGKITVTQSGATGSQTLNVGSGELRGLMDVRDTQLPAVQDQLGEFVSKTVDAINQAHNASSAVPPPATLSGRNTGLDLPTAISGFTGKTSVAIVNASGSAAAARAISTSRAGTMSVNGGAATGFTSANFLTSLNTALGASGTASFNNGALTLNATTPGTGIAIQDDATTPSQKAGRGFSQFFGLNDLITSSGITNYATGLQAPRILSMASPPARHHLAPA